MRSFLLAAATVLVSLSLSAAEIDVRVTDASGAGVKNAVVYAIPAHPMPLAKRTATLDQVNRTFVPHVLPVQTGTWIEFPNSDNILHQVYSLSPVRRFQLPLYVGKPARPIQFPDPGVVEVGCNIHEQMSAYIVVVDTPFFSATDGGKATLHEVAPGDYTVHVWYAGMKSEPAPQKIRLAAEEHPSLAFTASAR